MGNSKELRIGKLQEKKVFSLIVNKYDDTIELPLDDAGFVDRILNLYKWLDENEKIADEKEKELLKKFEGREMMVVDEDNNPSFDFEYIDEVLGFHMNIYKSIYDKIESVFGKDSLKKYFRVFYESNPDFVPDEDAISDFLEEIAPVINTLFDTKVEYKRKRKEKFDKYKKVYHK